MDWTVNDGLYQRFLKWKLKCENILDCELAMLPESKKCKKVIASSGVFGMDQYVSWCLPMDDLCLDTIWSKYEDLCKSQANEVRARFGLLTNFRQGNRSRFLQASSEWSQSQIWPAFKLQTREQICRWVVQCSTSTNVPCQVPTRKCKYIPSQYILVLPEGWRVVSKTINDSIIDLEKFPASEVRQLAKKMEASKAMACHIKQVACDRQAAQNKLMRHQHTDLPPSKHKKKQSFKSRPPSHKWYSSEH